MKKFFSLTLALGTFFVATTALAATVPTFDWVHAYNSTLINATILKVVDTDPVDGSVYFTSRFSGTADLDPTGGTDSITSVGGNDSFFSKFSLDGTYEWTKTWGSTQDDSALAVAVTEGQDVYVASGFRSTADFDPGAGISYATSSGGVDIALSKFDSDGNFQWVRTWGYTGSDETVTNVTTDSNGNAYVAGYFAGSIDFNPSAGIATSTVVGAYDPFLSKFSPDGTWQWTKTWGGTGYDWIVPVAVDSQGDVYIGGLFNSTVDFDPGAGTANRTSNGGYDSFLSKFDSDGNFQWVQAWGGTGSESVNAIVVSSEDDLYVDSTFGGTVDIDPGVGTTNVTEAGGGDTLLSKFDSDGNFLWGKAIGGTGFDWGKGSIVDGGGSVYTIGYFPSTADFNPGDGVDSVSSQGGADAYIAKFSSGGDYQFVKTFGGSLDEYPDSVAYSNVSGERLLIVGQYKSAPADFDPSEGTQNFSSDGTDVFLLSLSLDDAAVTVSTSDTDLSEVVPDDSLTYTAVLTTPPSDDVIVTLSSDSQVGVSPSSLTFTTTNWSTPQTVTVTVVDDTTPEGEHTSTITHTVSSNDTTYDGISVSSVAITITDNDSGKSSSGSGSRSSGRSNTAPNANTDGPQASESVPVTVHELQARITEIKKQLIVLLRQRIADLQEQIAAILAGREN